MRFTSILSVAAVLAVSAVGHTAWGQDTTTQQCMTDAKDVYNTKRKALQDEFKAAKDACRNVDHVCAEACRTTREACVAGPEAAVDTCNDACKATQKAARDTCKANTAEGSAERKQCTDAAELAAYECRHTCRDSTDRDALKQCKDAFKTCIQGCTTGTPTN